MAVWIVLSLMALWLVGLSVALVVALKALKTLAQEIEKIGAVVRNYVVYIERERRRIAQERGVPPGMVPGLPSEIEELMKGGPS